MYRRISALVALACCLVIVAAPSTPAAERVSIRDVDVSRFPLLRVTVALDTDRAVGPGDLTLVEQGTPVTEGLAISSLEEEGVAVDVVLALDTSGSMEGEPLAAARAAARVFLAGLPRNVRVGVVTFSDEPRVVQRLTRDHARAAAILEGLSASGETALYDAVVRASKLFSGRAQRNIVLLSDGGDTASDAGLGSAAAAAADSEAAIFPVGLRSGEADISALRSLAKQSGGRYSSAGAADLSSVYEGLATELSGQFVLEYTSRAESGEQFSIVLTAAGGSDDVLVLAPRVEAAPGPVARPADPVPDPILEGSAGLAIVLVLCFAATFLVVLMFIARRENASRETRLRKLAQLPEASDSDPEDAPGPSWVPRSMVRLGDRLMRKEEKSHELDRRLERAGWAFRPAEFVGMVTTLGLAGFIVGLLLTNLIIAFAFAGIIGYSPYAAMGMATRKRSAALQAQLPDILMILASSLRAGHSFLQALDAVAQEIGAPASHEFNRVVAEVRLGRAVTDSLNDLAERVNSDDFRWAVMAVNIQRDVGGNLAEVLDTVASTMRERERVRGQVKVLSAEGRLSIGILTALPFVVALYMILVRPDYIGLLVTTQIGVVMTAVSASLMVLGFLWMKKVVKVDV